MKKHAAFLAVSLSVILLASCRENDNGIESRTDFPESQKVEIPDLAFTAAQTPPGRLERIENYNYSGTLPDTSLFSTKKTQLFYDNQNRINGISTVTYTRSDNKTIELVTEKAAFQYKDDLIHRVFQPIATNGANIPHMYNMLEYVYNPDKQASHVLYYIVDLQGNASFVKENSRSLQYDGQGRLVKEENLGSTYTVSYTWDGNNVRTRAEGFADGTYNASVQYRYDSRPSILKMPYGLAETMQLMQPGVSGMNENNIVSAEGKDGVEFINQYDGKDRLIQRGINMNQEAPVVQKFVFKN